MMVLLAPILAMSQALAAPPYWVRRIAPAYRGDWALSPGQCAPGPADSGNIRITARRIQSFESRMDVRRASPVGTSSLDVEGRVHHGGELFGGHVRLRLINNNVRGVQELGIGRQGDDSLSSEDIYVRCER